MRIAVIGAGAMGSIYGGHLSLKNEVYLVATNAAVVEHLQKEGLKLQEFFISVRKSLKRDGSF